MFDLIEKQKSYTVLRYRALDVVLVFATVRLEGWIRRYFPEKQCRSGGRRDENHIAKKAEGNDRKE